MIQEKSVQVVPVRSVRGFSNCGHLFSLADQNQCDETIHSVLTSPMQKVP